MPNTVEQTMSQVQFFSDLSYWVKALFYGDPGCGKTILACTAPNPVLLDADGTGALALLNHPEIALNVMVLQVRNFNQVLDVLDAAMAGHPRFKDRLTYIIDTMTLLQARHLDEHVDKERVSNPNRAPIPFQQDYKYNTQAMRRLVTMFKEVESNLICTAHAVTDKDEGTGIIKTHPLLTPKLESTMQGLFDIFGYMESETDGDFSTTRTLQIMPSRRVKAKTRVGGLDPIMKEPNFQTIIDAKTKMVDRLKALQAEQAKAELLQLEEANQRSVLEAAESPSEQGEKLTDE